MEPTPPTPPSTKPLRMKAYGSICHLPGSRRGPGDHGLNDAEARLLLERAKNPRDVVYVQEKLDGSNVCAARVGDTILALNRAGYLATTSPYPMHHAWARFVRANAQRFRDILQDGERACGEWLMVAHGTRYALPHEPFVLFDVLREHKRRPLADVATLAQLGGFTMPRLIHTGGPISVARVLDMLEPSGHGALDPVEGAVWRCEREDPSLPMILAKYVRPEKQDGCYLPSESGQAELLNTWSGECSAWLSVLTVA